jgi:hypothetical protein
LTSESDAGSEGLDAAALDGDDAEISIFGAFLDAGSAASAFDPSALGFFGRDCGGLLAAAAGRTVAASLDNAVAGHASAAAAGGAAEACGAIASDFRFLGFALEEEEAGAES